MSLTEIVLIAGAPRQVFRLSFHFGLFQGVMPVLGWLAGFGLVRYIEAVDHWIAFGLLAFVGIRMIRSGASGSDELKYDPSRGWSLVTLSVATSIDAFAVGLSLAMLQVEIWYPCMVIGLITAALSVIGIFLGRILGSMAGRWMEVAGGCLLILIGIRILFSHLV